MGTGPYSPGEGPTDEFKTLSENFSQQYWHKTGTTITKNNDPYASVADGGFSPRYQRSIGSLSSRSDRQEMQEPCMYASTPKWDDKRPDSALASSWGSLTPPPPGQERDYLSGSDWS